MSCSADHLVVYDGTPNLYDELQLVIAGLQMSLQCKDEHIAELEARLEQQQPQQCGVTDDAASTGVPPTYDTISVPSTPTELCGTPSSDHALQDSQDALHAALQQNEVLRSRLAILSKEMEAMQHVHRHRIAAMQAQLQSAQAKGAVCAQRLTQARGTIRALGRENAMLMELSNVLRAERDKMLLSIGAGMGVFETQQSRQSHRHSTHPE